MLRAFGPLPGSVRLLRGADGDPSHARSELLSVAEVEEAMLRAEVHANVIDLPVLVGLPPFTVKRQRMAAPLAFEWNRRLSGISEREKPVRLTFVRSRTVLQATLGKGHRLATLRTLERNRRLARRIWSHGEAASIGPAQQGFYRPLVQRKLRRH